MKLTRFEKILLLLGFAKELFQKFWQKICGTAILKASACLSIVAIGTVIIFSHKPHAQSLPPPLPSCHTLGTSVTPIAGVNCHYFGLPLCNTVIAPQVPQHRINCADIIDLPLCTDIVTGPGVSVMPGKNCVGLCSEPAYGSPDPTDLDLVRSEDYAIHNRECIRFCDNVEAGVVANPGINCSQRKCHQVVEPVAGVNCNLLPCNLLTPDELNKPKFYDATKKYCEGGGLKCYNFTGSQLPYVKQRPVNPICVIHTCTPSSTFCGPDDVSNITSKGKAYEDLYIAKVNAGQGLGSKSYCTNLHCKPVIKSQYRCTSQTYGSPNIHNVGNVSSISGTVADIYRNPNCDTTGDGAFCGTLVPGANASLDTLHPVTNYCYKTIDCNNQENAQASECFVATNTSGDNTLNIDPFQSWFYRPAPSHKATNSDGILLPMRDSLCYSEGQMIGNKWGEFVGFKIGLLDLEFWYHSNWFDSTRSPGACGGYNIGNRGTGYVYVCGTDWLLYNRAAEEAVYFKGYATTDFSGANPTYKVTICTRFSNTLQKDACGSRTCGVDAAFDDFTGQACGGDVCRELTLEANDPTKCLMTGGGDMSGGCVERLDDNGLASGYMRVRAVKYDDKICGFLDVKGQFAYNGMFFRGDESLTFSDDNMHPTNVCVNDNSSTDGTCRGHDSNSSKGSASEWRTILRVHYVDNNRPTGLQGYLDKAGKFYKAQTCPKVTMRIPPPDQYNIATANNSEKLFAPPVTIFNVLKTRGGPRAIVPSGEVYGKTDFHYPEIEVQFGISVYKMSLGFGYTGGAEDPSVAEYYPSSPSSLILNTTFGGRAYEAKLFVKKEFFENNVIPQFCLYRRIKDQNGADVAPLNIGCVARNAPDIDNARSRILDSSLTVRKMRIVPKSNNEYNNAEISIRYLDGGGVNKLDDGCSQDDQCTPEISLSNPSYETPVCIHNIENHKLCVQREECSRIYIECIQNEIDINNAKNSNQPLTIFLAIRKKCNETLVPKCNRKKGITAYGGDIYNQVPAGAVVLNNTYGWFNELCVVAGFETKLRRVLAYNIAGGIVGKCLIDLTSPYLTDNNPATNCDVGGRAPNCICAEAPQGYTSSSTEAIRLETPHEAGLCVDMPVPTFCPVIDYTPVSNSDAADTEYVKYSLGNSSYSNNLYSNNFGGVHLTHQDRTGGAISGYAEFVQALPGMNNVRGECKGFWTYSNNSSGVTLFPLQSCLNDHGVAAWDRNVRNGCVRFSCPNVVTAGPELSGAYQGLYGVHESGEFKGASNGFAVWPKYTKTNDFLETRNAQACIPGFKPLGSAAVVDASGAITSYSGGTLPSRQCNQLGTWSSSPVNSCARISCVATNPTSSAGDNGGASFSTVYASRSRIRTQPESIALGTCNEALGFFQSGAPPSRECDYLGNWLPVKGGCVTSCANILNDAGGNIQQHGYAKWEVVQKSLILYQHCNYGGWNIVIPTGYYPTNTNVAGTNQNILDASSIKITGGVHADLYAKANYGGRSVHLTGDVSCFDGNPWNFNDMTYSIKVESDAGSRLTASFRGCVAGYVTNPYPPATNNNGEHLASAIANDLSRAAQDPTRSCRSVGSTYDVWEGVVNPCINKCPGFDSDSRIGVGITRHPYASLAEHTIDIRWDTADFQTYSYATNWNAINPNAIPSFFNASYFTSSKSSNYYLMRRYCNTNGRWSEPEALCPANQGQIGNATYFRDAAYPGYSNSIAADTDEAVTGSCVANYLNYNRGLASAPKRKCLFANAYKYIDRVYLDFVNNTKDCEEKSCGNFPGAIGQRGKVLAANRSDNTDLRFVTGSGKISGSCLNNELNSENTTVNTSLDSDGSLPYVKCKEDGTWSEVYDSSCN